MPALARYYYYDEDDDDFISCEWCDMVVDYFSYVHVSCLSYMKKYS